MKNLFILLTGLFLVSCASTSALTQSEVQKKTENPHSREWLIGQSR